MKIDLVIIDPQNDFCYPGAEIAFGNFLQSVHGAGEALDTFKVAGLSNPGALFVPGSYEDMTRLATFVDRVGSSLNDIHVTLDTHHKVDIAHPIFWIGKNGQHPDPFTIISVDDVDNGIWRTFNPSMQARATEYVHRLAENGRYPLCIWPPHCLIGTYGHNVVEPLNTSLSKWEDQFALVDYVTKGSNYWTEHYSAIKADVIDPTDTTTDLNEPFVKVLSDADIILLAGEARSHCLANTVCDIADEFDITYGTEMIKKLHLLTDATTDVADPPGTTMFTDMGEAFVKDMTARGMQLTTTKEFLT